MTHLTEFLCLRTISQMSFEKIRSIFLPFRNNSGLCNKPCFLLSSGTFFRRAEGLCFSVSRAPAASAYSPPEVLTLCNTTIGYCGDNFDIIMLELWLENRDHREVDEVLQWVITHREEWEAEKFSSKLSVLALLQLKLKSTGLLPPLPRHPTGLLKLISKLVIVVINFFTARILTREANSVTWKISSLKTGWV